MAIAAGACPSCGAPVAFKAGSSVSLVCPQCQHVVVRTDRDLVNLGRVADVTFGDAALAHGDSGVFQGKTFSVLGRVVMQHPQGGTWEEYYATFADQAPSWIEEAMGRWYVLQQVPAFAPPLDGLAPGVEVNLGPYGMFVVDEVSQGSFLSAEGELPFSAAPGTIRRFADLSAADGSRASLQQVEGAEAIEVFVGVETTFDALGVFRRSGERAEHAVSTKEVQCTACGAPLPARKDPKAERFVCKYCGALADAATLAVIARQDISRLAPAIPLGTEGTLNDIHYTVIGYVRRTTTVDDELFAWEEYLLYNPGRGYAWLVCDEGVWRLGGAIAAGEVDVNDFPHTIKHGGRAYRMRNSGDASVSHVLGEFYWQVSVNETVFAYDFESRDELVSREESGTEVNWTHLVTVTPSSLERAFGVRLGAGGAPGQPTEAETEGLWSGLMTAGWLIPAVLLLAFFGITARALRGCHATPGTTIVTTDGGVDEDGYPVNRGAGGAGGAGGFGGK
jgi:predicted RNA-binding Zn-ribbon protein involved in translation (DUF1610 family)